MATPTAATGQGLAGAHLQIVAPSDGQVIPLRFNPTEYQLSKGNTFADVAIPGLESPPIQYVRGGAETLQLEVLVDTSDTLEDVAAKYVNKIRGLMTPDREEHAPPIVRFVWDRQVFTGVLENLGVTYTLFDPDGVPLRAKLNMTLKEYRPAAVQVRENPLFSATVDKTYVVHAGDTLSGIAGAVYRDPTLWRAVARANDIKDPRALQPGAVLAVPRLT